MNDEDTGLTELFAALAHVLDTFQAERVSAQVRLPGGGLMEVRALAGGAFEVEQLRPANVRTSAERRPW